MNTIIDLVLALKNVSIFSEIPENIMAEVAEIIEVMEFKRGELIMKKGEIGNCMYVIREGSVKVHDGAKILAQLEKNDIVGELSLLAPVPRTADVTALEDLVLFRIDRAYFLDLLYEEPEIMNGILKVLVQRIIRLNQKLQISEALL